MKGVPFSNTRRHEVLTKKCTFCRKFFDTRNPNKQFCNARCRVYSFRKQKAITDEIGEECSPSTDSKS